MADVVEHIQEFMDTLKDYKQSGPEAIAAIFTEDAKLMPNHHIIVKGRPFIEQYYRSKAEQDPNGEIEVEFHVNDVNFGGELIIADGDFHVSRNHEHELDHGKFMIVIKQNDGSFEIFRLMLNTSRTSGQHCGDQTVTADVSTR